MDANRYKAIFSGSMISGCCTVLSCVCLLVLKIQIFLCSIFYLVLLSWSYT